MRHRPSSTAPDPEQVIRVLMTTDTVGGVWQYSLDLAAGLCQHGVEVTLAVLGPAPTPDQQALVAGADINVLLTGSPLDWTAETPGEVEEAGLALARLAARMKPDIVHLNSPALSACASFGVPVVGVCHSCVATWWQAVRSGPFPPAFVWRSDLTRRGYQAADLLLAPTIAFAEETAQFYDLPAPPVVVHNGRRALPKTPRTPPAPFAFTAGRLWDEGKNLAAIDRAAARLSTPVLAAGPLQGPNGAQANLGHVRTLGRLTDLEIAQHLSAQPVFISAARYEPFGLAALEAAQCGCALVLSDIPTFRELWNDAAILIHPDDDASLAFAIETLMCDPGLRHDLGVKARARAATFSVDAMSAGVMDAYRHLLAPSATQTPCEEAIA
jgi:glycosyltransferase involved in cell wall biosynthesis